MLNVPKKVYPQIERGSLKRGKRSLFFCVKGCGVPPPRPTTKGKAEKTLSQ